MARVGGSRGRTSSGGAFGADGSARNPWARPEQRATAAQVKRGMDAGQRALDLAIKAQPARNAVARMRANAARDKGTGRSVAPFFLQIFKTGNARLGTRARKTGPGAGRLG